VLGEGLGVQIALLGALIAVISAVAGFGAQSRGLHVQTAIFVTLGMAQLGVALALRVRVHRTWRQRSLELAILGAAVLQLLAVYVPVLQELLGTRSLPAQALGQLLVLAAVPGVLVRLGGWWRARHS
jgi:P-type Ca2+ transporter type 2C